MRGKRRWLLSLVVLVLAAAIPELVLRLVGFQHASGVQFGWPTPEMLVRFEPDERLFWKLPPSRKGINSLGFVGPEIEIPKPEGTWRALFLGDSCTFRGYPRTVEKLLARDGPPGGPRCEAVNLGIPGYTSHQGRLVAEIHAARMQADLAFVWYGWNDHWIAYGSIDSEKLARPPGRGPRSATLRWAGEHLRLVQAIRWLAGRLGGGRSRLESPRVPPDEYRRNLEGIHETLSERGVPVVFITAPTSHYQLGVPDQLIEQGVIDSGEACVRLHRQYNGIVREVAAERGAGLLDLEADLDRLPELEAIFERDGIHPNGAGLRLVAERIAAYVAESRPPR